MIGIVLIALAAILLIRGCWRIAKQTQDLLHPTFLLALPLAAMYVVQPLLLLFRENELFFVFLSEENFGFVAAVNAIGIGAILAGLNGPRKSEYVPVLQSFAFDNSRLYSVALTLGVVSVVCYLFTIYQVGGFSVAYGSSYGGGWTELGYVREAYWLAVPALVTLALSRKNFDVARYALAALFASPLLMHGLLGARRGPTAAAFMTLWLSRTLATGKRPGKLQLLFGISLVGLLMLFLIANRSTINLSSVDNVTGGLDSYATSVGSGNEYIYGGGVVLASFYEGIHFYGGRYIAIVFIRPIPSRIFPEKYTFAATFLGIPNLSESGSNLGTGNLDFLNTVGWRPAVGAAPGLIADLWLEFGFSYILSLWVIGRVYWFAWHRMRCGNIFWIISYTVMAAYSFYLITQTLEAMLFRFLLSLGAVTIVWFFVEGRLPKFDLLFRSRKSSNAINPRSIVQKVSIDNSDTSHRC